VQFNESNTDLWYIIHDTEETDKIDAIVNLSFLVIILITMFLCFFSLSSSMGANIVDMQKEIAILRALGISSSRIKLLFVYEAFILVLASSLLGILIGMFVGFSLMMQESLFNDIPLEFYFPLLQFIFLLVTTMICAIVSTYTPAK